MQYFLLKMFSFLTKVFPVLATLTAQLDITKYYPVLQEGKDENFAIFFALVF